MNFMLVKSQSSNCFSLYFLDKIRYIGNYIDISYFVKEQSSDIHTHTSIRSLHPSKGIRSEGHARTSGKGLLFSALPVMNGFLFYSTVKPRSLNNSITRSKASTGTRTKRASEGTSASISGPISSSACISCRA